MRRLLVASHCYARRVFSSFRVGGEASGKRGAVEELLSKPTHSNSGGKKSPFPQQRLQAHGSGPPWSDGSPLLYFLCGSGFATASWLAYGAVQSGGALHNGMFSDEYLEQIRQRAAAVAGVPAVLVARAQGLLPQLRHSLIEPVAAAVASQQPPMWGPFAIADAAAKAAPAVVNIMCTSEGFPFQGAASGSGFIFDASGVILTNAHVVADAMPRGHLGGNGRAGRPLMVTLQDGRTFEGRVVSSDRVTDLAVVKIESDAPLPVVQLGSSSRLRVGEWVVALGSPLHLQNSVTCGIISCVDRKAVELGLADARTDYIQTDAAINRGNSGGPLVNLHGEVIGISNMKAIAADGVSFAIPVDTAKEVMAQLALHGRVIRPYIGIKMLQLTPANVEQFKRRNPGFPHVSYGILVPHVYAASPAEKAGLRPGDVIVGFAECNEEACMTTGNMIRELSRHVGRSMQLRVQRNGEVMTMQITASEAAS